MKKSKLLILAIAIVSLGNTYAQSMGKGKTVLYLGVGGGSGHFSTGKYKGVGHTYRSTPTIHLGFEHGILEDNIPKSIIGIGAHLSLSTAAQTYRDKFGYGWDKRWTDISVLFRGFYHHKFLVGEKWDVYASLMGGIRQRTYTFSNNSPYYDNYKSTDGGIAPAVGVAIGGRFYVSKNFGFYAELSQGYNVDFAQIGLAFKL
jgi:hypothetical protein